MNCPQMKSSTQRPDCGRLNASFRLPAIRSANKLEEISKEKSQTTDHPKDLSSFLESSSRATAPPQESFINSSSAAAVSEALALLGTMTNGSF
jgi:hypothetical protein